MKTAIVIGHHEFAKGAIAPYFSMPEFDFYSMVASCLDNVTVFQHNGNIKSYTKRIQDTASRINKNDFDLIIELHFNSFTNPAANGCETLFFHKSEKGKEYANRFSALVNKRTGIALRSGGIKPLSNIKQRGFASVYYTNSPTILIEPFFGSNTADCQKIKSPENMADIINEFIECL